MTEVMYTPQASACAVLFQLVEQGFKVPVIIISDMRDPLHLGSSKD